MEVTRELFQFSVRGFELAQARVKVQISSGLLQICNEMSHGRQPISQLMSNLLSRQSSLQRPGRSEIPRQGNEYGSPWHKNTNHDLPLATKLKRTSVVFWE